MPLSSIIKAHQGMDAVPFSFREVENQSELELHQRASPAAERAVEPEEPEVDPLQELEETIQNRLMEAERRAQELESEGYEKGYAQGLKDGSETGLKGMLIVQEHLDKIFKAMQALPPKIFADYREWFIASTLAVARHVIRKELDTHPGILAHLIGSLLEEVEESHSLILYLNPKDVESLEEHTSLKDILRESNRSFSLRPDPQLERGGCRIETELQLLDASIETQFALIEQAVRQEEPVAENVSSE